MIQATNKKVLKTTLKINAMKLKNTPWTCEFEPMQNWHIKDNSGYWFALAIEDADTARAIAALPETLAELERHKKLHQGMLDALTQAEKELERVKEVLKKERTNKITISRLYLGIKDDYYLYRETLKEIKLHISCFSVPKEDRFESIVKTIKRRLTPKE